MADPLQNNYYSYLEIRNTNIRAINTNRLLIQRTQSKILRNIINANAGWFISNEAIYRDLNVNTIQETITKCSTKIVPARKYQTKIKATHRLI